MICTCGFPASALAPAPAPVFARISANTLSPRGICSSWGAAVLGRRRGKELGQAGSYRFCAGTCTVHLQTHKHLPLNRHPHTYLYLHLLPHLQPTQETGLRLPVQKTAPVFNRQQEVQLQSQIEAYRVLTSSQGHLVSFSPEPELLTSHAP